MSEVLSRRGIVGLIAAFAAAPKAVEAQAVEVLRERMFERDEGHAPPPLAQLPGHQRLTIEQMALKPFWTEANRKARMRVNAIRRCNSMSPAAKQAYIKIAQQESAPILLKWSKLMGWAGPDADESDIYG